MRGKSEIDTLFEKGKYLSDGFVLIKFLDSDSTKFLFAVSSKKFKRAVDRNKVKRLIREAIREIDFSKVNAFVIYNIAEIKTLQEIKEDLKKIKF
jgi:ribonuclease P protein component